MRCHSFFLRHTNHQTLITFEKIAIHQLKFVFVLLNTAIQVYKQQPEFNQHETT